MISHTTFSQRLKYILALTTALLILGASCAFGQGMEVAERDEDGNATRVNLNIINGELKALLKWLAEETGLIIIASEQDVKDKKFSITNLKNITIGEALDHLKTVLAIYNLTSIRTNNTILITTKQKAVSMKIPVRDAFEVAEYKTKLRATDEVIIQPILLNNASASELVNSIRPLLSKTANVSGDWNNNALIITDVASNIFKVCKVLEICDQPEPVALRIKIIQLQNSDARSVVSTLNELFREETRMTNALRKMAYMNPDNMRNTLQKLKERGGGIDMASGRIQLIPYANSNSNIVKASEGNIAIIESIIEQLDTTEFLQLKLRVFQLQHADVEQAARELESILQTRLSSRYRRWQERRARWGEQVQRGSELGYGGIIGDVRIATDARLNSLLIFTDESNFPFIEKIISTLDQAETEEEFRIVFLEVADAEQMIDTLNDIIYGETRGRWGRRNTENLFFRKMERREFGGPGYGITGNVNLVSDSRLNAILISTEAKNIAAVEKLVKELDRNIPEQEWATKIHRLRHADAENVASIINDVYRGEDNSRGGWGIIFGTRYGYFGMSSQRRSRGTYGSLSGNVSVQQYLPLNALIISASTKRNFNLVTKFIHEIDTETPKEHREITDVINLEYADAQELETLLNDVWSESDSSGFNFTRYLFGVDTESKDINSLKGKVSIGADEQTNSLVITTQQRYWKDTMELISELDTVRGQVFLDIQILEITLDENTKFGLELDAQKILHEWGEDDKEDKLTGEMDTNLLLGEAISGFYYTLVAKEFMSLLHALKDENKVRAVSRPAILTRDNEPATFAKVRRVPYLQNVTYTSDRDKQALYDYDFLTDIGVTVKITPHIAKIQADETGKRAVGLDIVQIQASNLLGFTDFDAPMTEDSTVNAYIDVEDGQPILIGGMMKSKDQEIERKIPLLGSIPIVGRLFKQTEAIREDSEVVMIITPHIVDIKNPEDVEKLEKLKQEKFGGEWLEN